MSTMQLEHCDECGCDLDESQIGLCEDCAEEKGEVPRATYKFTIYVDVFDRKQLLEAAKAHPDYCDDTGIDDALVCLLDPSTLPGCVISHSDAERCD